jgi:hypothetical protein
VAQQKALADYKSQRYPIFAVAQEPDREFTVEERAHFDALDAALHAAPPLSSSILAWRGFTRYDNPVSGPNKWRPPAAGSVQSFPSWTSVSMTEIGGVTEAYLMQDKGPHEYSVLMEIELPPGQRCIYIEAARPHYSHEAELLLPRPINYEVVSFESLVKLRTMPVRHWPAGNYLMHVRVV